VTIRFRRTVKIAPGLHINFNKNSTSLSIGSRGAHYTVSSSGRRTISAGIPGTGIYAYQTINPKSSSRKGAVRNRDGTDPLAFPGPTPRPSLFSSRAEKEFSAFLIDIYSSAEKYSPSEIVAKAKALTEKYTALIHPLNVLTFLYILNDETYEGRLLEMGEHLWSSRITIFSDPMLVKYFGAIRPVTQITKGISVTEILNQQQFGFIWAEVLQVHEKFNEALAVLHDLDATQTVAIALADLQLSLKDYDSVLETTNEITNEDDATVILLSLRGIAFREKSLLDASLECYHQALSQKKRSKEVLHRARFERSFTYQKMGKTELAKKDLELILVDDPTNREVIEQISALR
jgi:tetratricopeptide (TPR) repeat protein